MAIRMTLTPFLARLVLATLLLGLASAARAAEPAPLRPSDTSSPRATLLGFIETTDAFYTNIGAVMADYAASGRLYPTEAEFAGQARAYDRARDALQYLDLSEISPVLRASLAVERVLQLKEILDRIDLPDPATMPGAAPRPDEVGRGGLKRWRLPDTEIDIVMIADGPRAGEYLFSAATVDRLPAFYERVKHLPNRSAPAQAISAIYSELSGGRLYSLYEAYLASPVGLGRIIPPRWILRLPGWAQVSLAGATLWQWLGLGLGFAIAAGFLAACRRLARRLAQRLAEPDAGSQREVRWDICHSLPVPIAIVVATEFFLPLWYKIFHIGGTTLIVLTYAGTALLFLTAAWLCYAAAVITGEVLAASERVERSSLDNQLVRLGMRLAGITGAVAILMTGADRLGFPAYSVLAGLGVGGLAVALAARDTIANLLGSMLIMFEKPFRVGDVIRVAGSEGTVEDVGFRSTRIRTPDNSLLSIPSNAVVNAVVENMSLRPMRRQRFFVQVTYDTPRKELEHLTAAIREVIQSHPATGKTNAQVRLNAMSESSLDILVLFHLDVADYTSELAEREAILLAIMQRAEDLGIAFAFPTRTVHMEMAAAQRPTESATLSSRGG